MHNESIQEIRKVLLEAFGSAQLENMTGRDRFVSVKVETCPEAWVTIYGDYMDFSYKEQTPPEALIPEVFVSLQPAQIIDWSPGRLACVQYKKADAVALATAIDALLKRLYGLTDYKLVASIETWGRA